MSSTVPNDSVSNDSVLNESVSHDPVSNNAVLNESVSSDPASNNAVSSDLVANNAVSNEAVQDVESVDVQTTQSEAELPAAEQDVKRPWYAILSEDWWATIAGLSLVVLIISRLISNIP